MSERQSVFCVLADSHIVQFGAEASFRQAHGSNAEVHDVPDLTHAGACSNHSLGAISLPFFVCKTKKMVGIVRAIDC